ncbi:hypothetical protein EGN69_17590 [Pseudomonas monteilii]|nr:hypothetical protein EGN69_17590 [Pseudomonas monteilii]
MGGSASGGPPQVRPPHVRGRQPHRLLRGHGLRYLPQGIQHSGYPTDRVGTGQRYFPRQLGTLRGAGAEPPGNPPHPGGVDPKSIAVVTPFGDVARQVAGSHLARAGATCGTVHTMQGKEASCVVLVLGGNADPQRPGARDWAVSKPNLLNVAVTRAKQRLYVIGDRADWAKRRYFSEIMDLLPVVDVEAALAAMEGSVSVNARGDGARSAGDLQ